MASGNQKVIKAIESFFALEGQLITEQQIFEQLDSQESTPHPDLGKIRRYKGKFGTFWITSRNNIVYYMGESLTGKNKQIDANEANEIAVKFAQQHVEDFTERNFKMKPLSVDMNSFTMRWNEQPKPDIETSIYPNRVDIVVDLSKGRVNRFFASDVRLVRTTQPKLDKEQAEAKIKSGFDKSAIEEIKLMEQPLFEQSKVITIWTALVMIHGTHGPETVRVTIDADTGELIPE